MPVWYQCRKKASKAARRHQARLPGAGRHAGGGAAAHLQAQAQGRGTGAGQVQGVGDQQQGAPAFGAQMGPHVEEVLQGVLAAVLQQDGLQGDPPGQQPVPPGLGLAAGGASGGAAGHEDPGREAMPP